jgi:hypothetical protein
MENNNKKNEIKIELTPEVANGHYANLAMIAHSPTEFFIDFIAMAPNMPQAKVQSRIIMSPENAKQLLFALRENVERYENTFGVIEPRRPKAGSNGELNNPFKA